MKKHLKFLLILPILVTLGSCNNKKQYDYSSYYAKYNVQCSVDLFCWKEWFQWNSCIIEFGSIGYFYPEDVVEFQYNLPCPLETMKEIIKKNKEVNPQQSYIIYIVDKPANEKRCDYMITEKNYNELMYLYNYLEIEPKDYVFDESIHK